MSSGEKNINPGFKKYPFKKYSIEDCISGIQNQKKAIISYLISKTESHLEKDQVFVQSVVSKLQDSGRSKKIAISGSPGVGKSTFINSYGKYLISKDSTIAVLPVDPTSNISKGSILGDKTRMEDIVSSDQVYVKPMPSSFSLGGVAPASYMAVHICALAGFDYIFIETVGVGQSEYEAKNLSDMFILLLQPGGGDDLQGIKRGIMEMADLLIVNKADGALEQNANISFDAYNQSLKLMLPNAYNWKPKVLKYSSMEGKPLELNQYILDYFEYMAKDNRLVSLRKNQHIQFFDQHYKDILLGNILADTNTMNTIQALKKRLDESDILPFEALQELRKSLDK